MKIRFLPFTVYLSPTRTRPPCTRTIKVPCRYDGHLRQWVLLPRAHAMIERAKARAKARAKVR